MTRIALPNRRRSITQTARGEGFDFTLTIGFDDRGLPKEVFADGAKYGTLMSSILSDVCVLISCDLQRGVTIETLGKSLIRVPDPAAGKGVGRPGSPIGLIIEMIVLETRKGRL